MNKQRWQMVAVGLASATAVNAWIFPMLWRITHKPESAAWFFGQSRSRLLRGIGDLLVRS